jgi:hypothetical protein
MQINWNREKFIEEMKSVGIPESLAVRMFDEVWISPEKKPVVPRVTSCFSYIPMMGVGPMTALCTVRDLRRGCSAHVSLADRDLGIWLVEWEEEG